MGEKWYSLKDASKKTGCELNTLKEYLKSGKITGSKIVRSLFGKEVRLSESALKDLLRLQDEIVNDKDEALQVNGHPGESADDLAKELPGVEKMIERYEEALLRNGWLEGQLDLHKRLLFEREDSIKGREEEIREQQQRMSDLERSVEERLTQARALEAKYREEKSDWQKRLAGQAETIHEAQQDLEREKERSKNKDDKLGELKKKLAVLEKQHRHLVEENDKQVKEIKLLQKVLEQAQKRWWKFGRK